MRFLVSRRWLGFLLVVAAMALGAVRLGDWQFHRLDERRADNQTIVANLKAAPLPVAEVLAVGRSAGDADQWRQVTATGTWDDEHSVVVRYRTRDGSSGVDVVTPLVTTSGAAVLVDRGWMATSSSAVQRPKLPPAATGRVTVTGYVRIDATGRSTDVDALSTRAISSVAIEKVLPYPVYGGFLERSAESPPPHDGLVGVELPEIDDGPHFFYGLQWWFFGFLAVVGFLYLAYDEWRQRALERAGRSTGRTPAPGDRADPHPAGRE